MDTVVPNSGLFELTVDTAGYNYLKDAAKWAKFLALVGFIFCAFFVLLALVLGTLLNDMITSMSTYGSYARVVITFTYGGLAVLNFFPCLFLYNFAAKMQNALRDNDQVKLTSSFKNMRAFFRYVGVLMIISLCFWLLFVLALILQAKLLHPGTGTGV